MNAKLRHRILSLALILLFLLVGIWVYHTFFFFLNDFGSGDKLGQSSFAFLSDYLIYYLSTLIGIYLVFVIYYLVFPRSLEGKRKTLKVNGIILSGLGLVLLIMSIIKVAGGTFSIIEGTVTSLFPLDVILYAVAYILFGSFMAVYGFRFYKELDGDTYYPVSGPLWKRMIDGFLKGTFAVFALYYCGALEEMWFTFDYSFDHVWAMIGVYLLMAFPLVEMGFYLFGYKSRFGEELKKRLYQRNICCLFFMIGLALVAWVWIAETADPNFLTEAGTALFPLEHMLAESPAFGVIFAIFMSLVPPCVAFVSYYLYCRRYLQE